MAAVYVSNLVLNTGTTFSQTFTLEDSESNSTLDLTGYSVNSQMKKHPSSSKKTTFDATVLNASGGIIRVGLASTASVGLKAGRYVYDVLIKEEVGGGSTTYTLTNGNVYVYNPVSSAP